MRGAARESSEDVAHQRMRPDEPSPIAFPNKAIRPLTFAFVQNGVETGERLIQAEANYVNDVRDELGMMHGPLRVPQRSRTDCLSNLACPRGVCGRQGQSGTQIIEYLLDGVSKAYSTRINDHVCEVGRVERS